VKCVLSFLRNFQEIYTQVFSEQLTKPSDGSEVQKQTEYDSVSHQLQQAQHHFSQSTWHWTHSSVKNSVT